MKPNDYAKLEKDSDFKKNYLKETPWWKSVLIIAPIFLLFIGLAGMLYLFHLDRLLSLYAIPYVLIFFIGTIWIKAIKKHLQKVIMTKPNSFQICLATPIEEKNGYVYAAFVNDTHRYNKHYVKNIVSNLSPEEISEISEKSLKKEATLIHSTETNTDFYVREFPLKDLNKRNHSWRDEECFEVLYIDKKIIPIIKKKDLKIK